MASLEKVPLEILFEICDYLKPKALVRLARTSSKYKDIALQVLYKLPSAKAPWLLHWAVECGFKETVRTLLVTTGANPNCPIAIKSNRESILKEQKLRWPGANWKVNLANPALLKKSPAKIRKNFYRRLGKYLNTDQPYSLELWRGTTRIVYAGVWAPYQPDPDLSLRDSLKRSKEGAKKAGRYVRQVDSHLTIFPLHLAAIFGHVDIARLLLKHGALTDVPMSALYFEDIREDCIFEPFPTWDTFMSPQRQWFYTAQDYQPEVLLYTPLYTAINRAAANRGFDYISRLSPSYEDMIQLLVEHGAGDISMHLDSRPGQFRHTFSTAHAFAAFRINTSLLQLVVRKKPEFASSIDLKDQDGLTPFWYACIKSNIEMIRYLASLGADVNCDLDHGQTYTGSGNDIGKGYTPFFHACSTKHFHVAALLAELGADITRPWLEKEGQPRSRVEIDHEVPYDRGSRYTVMCRPLDVLCLGAEEPADDPRPQLIQQMVKTGRVDVNLNPGWKDYRAPLLNAAAFLTAQLVEALLPLGADPNVRDYKGRTPLIVAFRSLDDSWSGNAYRHRLHLRRWRVVSALVAYGADVRAADEYGQTPLWLLCTLPRVTEPGPGDDEHDTKEAMRLERQLAEMLLDRGADPNACAKIKNRDKTTTTPLELARRGHNQELIGVLETAVEKTMSIDNQG
ncbi:ankyrin repeat-containing domain protein [Bombardia bombarda]|uniref:Ankyrin repeat-containing domain protein n=1 Tax=Bombardia bombarda TaxID=252184 RepID=A0AA39XCG5_9PEZI|nr:ankyrin repeat-containing domain protein [Bombardia bombarda]